MQDEKFPNNIKEYPITRFTNILFGDEPISKEDKYINRNKENEKIFNKFFPKLKNLFISVSWMDDGTGYFFVRGDNLGDPMRFFTCGGKE